jgi:hypothetical protein
MKVNWTVSIGYPTAKRSGSWDVEDDVTDEELNAMLQEEINECIDAWWEKEE